jgi:Uma2 family endonuclease
MAPVPMLQESAMLIADHPTMTPHAYLEWEARQATKHEYVAGNIYAMVGVSVRHNAIALNLAMALRQQLRGRPCQVLIGEVKLRVTKANAYYYPDLMVCCGEHHRQADGTVAVDDPTLVVEVLSPSTESTDRREKLGAYRALATLTDYVLVSQDEARVEIYRRTGDIGWQRILLEPGDALDIPSLEFSLPLTELYRGTDVDTEKAPASSL